MNRFLCAAVVVFLFCGLAHAFQNEPNGFRGVKWGQKLTGNPDFEPLSRNPLYATARVYERTGDKLLIGAAELKQVLYFEYENQFFSVLIVFPQEHYKYLLAELSKIYGPTTLPMVTDRSATWKSDDVLVGLDYNRHSASSRLLYSYLPIYEEYEKERIRKIGEVKDDL